MTKQKLSAKERVRRAQELARQVRERKPEMTEEEAKALADEAVREIVVELIREGRVKYEASEPSLTPTSTSATS